MAKKPKIIDKWILEPEEGLQITVPVRMTQQNLEYSEVYFVVDFVYDEHKFVKQSSDINELKKETLEWLKSVVKIESELFFAIKFRSEIYKRDYDEDHSQDGEAEERTYAENLRHLSRLLTWPSMNMDFEWEIVEIGKTSIGKPCHRTISSRYGGSRWIAKSYTDGGTLIPATEKNERALYMLIERFNQLSDRLNKMLADENFAKFMSLLNGDSAIAQLASCKRD